MQTFLQQLIKELDLSVSSLPSTTFVLPSKRAVILLKKELLAYYNTEVFLAPNLYSIEEFINEISGFQALSTPQALMELYHTYLEINKTKTKDSLVNFLNWGQTLLQDFSEIDSYHIDAYELFDYLSAVKDIEHWSQDVSSVYVANYLEFWKQLPLLYNQYTQRLTTQSRGYTGMIYKQARKRIDTYLQKDKDTTYILAGFNALNTCEQFIFQHMLKENRARVFWDIDRYFLENTYHEVGFFIRQYRQKWKYYQSNPMEVLHDYYTAPKKIDCIGIPKQVGQALYANTILSTFTKEKQRETALVLADETLLQPVINNLPSNLERFNITMGLALKNISLSAFFHQWFELHLNVDDKGFPYKMVQALLRMPQSIAILGTESVEVLLIHIEKENRLYFDLKNLSKPLAHIDQPKVIENLSILFDRLPTVQLYIQKSFAFLTALQDAHQSQKVNHYSILVETYIKRYQHLLLQLEVLSINYKSIKDLDVVYFLWKHLEQHETLDYIGTPLKGLQLMGMLETRCLDFEHIILTSVNEGVLPKGKSIQSFVPYDIKLRFGIPTYREKDAIYAYHFYKLIQRASTVHLLYSIQTDGLGASQPSRFIQQLCIDTHPNHQLKSYQVTPEFQVSSLDNFQVSKTDRVLGILRDWIAKGASPSSLSLYLRNPLFFYYQYVLKVNLENSKKGITNSLFGTVVHFILQMLYVPLINQKLTVDILLSLSEHIDEYTQLAFKKYYHWSLMQSGKNLLYYEMVKFQIQQFIDYEISRVRSGDDIVILALEKRLHYEFSLSDLSLGKIALKGTVDRVEICNGKLRIIDYKTSLVLPNQVKCSDVALLIEDQKYDKALQLVIYAYIYLKLHQDITHIDCGIYSLKQIKKGFLPFALVSGSGKSKSEILGISTEQIKGIEQTVIYPILHSIFDPSIAFKEHSV